MADRGGLELPRIDLGGGEASGRLDVSAGVVMHGVVAHEAVADDLGEEPADEP